MSDIITPDLKRQPYWWDRAAPKPLPPVTLAPRYDVAVVGSGYTGLRAALELARAGRSVVVLEQNDPGSGASRRNAGYLGRVLKKSFAGLMKKRGEATALAMYRELGEAFTGVLQFIADEGIDCHVVRCGRYIAATSQRHLDEMASDFAVMREHLGYPFHVVPQAEQRSEFGSDTYHGGITIPDLAALHPGLYHLGLQTRALAAGVVISGGTRVTSIAKHSGDDRVEVVTDRGTLHARDAIIATNGYTPGALPWHARRVIPFQGYMAATEPLTDAQMRDAIPHGRTVLDSNTNIDFFRPAPDSPRLLFGGATGSGMQDLDVVAARLHAILARVLPQLSGVKLSHVWTGFCAGTFDMMPHVGGRDGIWHGLGYNFAGVPMGTHFGRKLALMIQGKPEGRSAFAEDRFTTLPFYRGRPWFVPLAMKWFDRQDGKRV